MFASTLKCCVKSGPVTPQLRNTAPCLASRSCSVIHCCVSILPGPSFCLAWSSSNLRCVWTESQSRATTTVWQWQRSTEQTLHATHFVGQSHIQLVTFILIVQYSPSKHCLYFTYCCLIVVFHRLCPYTMIPYNMVVLSDDMKISIWPWRMKKQEGCLIKIWYLISTHRKLLTYIFYRCSF